MENSGIMEIFTACSKDTFVSHAVTLQDCSQAFFARQTINKILHKSKTQVSFMLLFDKRLSSFLRKKLSKFQIRTAWKFPSFGLLDIQFVNNLIPLQETQFRTMPFRGFEISTFQICQSWKKNLLILKCLSTWTHRLFGRTNRRNSMDSLHTLQFYSLEQALII